MAMSLAIALRSLFCLLGCVMLATRIYTLSVDGFPFRKDLLTPWMSATLIDFYINVVALGLLAISCGILFWPLPEILQRYAKHWINVLTNDMAIGSAWVCYKESSWISASLWIVLLLCFGSITTCFYIVLQFLKLSTHDALEDPIHYVLLRYPAKDGAEDKRRFSVVTARIFFGALGCLMLATLVYTLLTDGSPFRGDLLTPWMMATLIDFYINVVALSVWVAYKESSWLNALIWIVLLICFGSITTCTYIVRQLFHLLPQDPIYLVLIKSSYRQV